MSRYLDGGIPPHMLKFQPYAESSKDQQYFEDDAPRLPSLAVKIGAPLQHCLMLVHRVFWHKSAKDGFIPESAKSQIAERAESQYLGETHPQ